MQPSTLFAVGVLALGALSLSRGGGREGKDKEALTNTLVTKPEKTYLEAQRYMIAHGASTEEAAESSRDMVDGRATEEDAVYWRHYFENEVNNFSRSWRNTYEEDANFAPDRDPYARYAAIVRLLTLPETPGLTRRFLYDPETGGVESIDVEVAEWAYTLPGSVDVETWNAFTATLPAEVTIHSSPQQHMEATLGVQALSSVISMLGQGVFSLEGAS